MEESKAFLEKFFSYDKMEELIIIGIHIALIYILLMALVYLERRMFKRFLERREKQSIDKTNLMFLRNVVIYSTYCVGFLSMFNQIPGMQQLSKTLLTGAGILAAAVGFGSQQAISNIVSGIFMVLFKPFRVGDHIDLGGENKGTVVDVSLRHTTIKNNENKMIIVPNNVLNNQSIVNSSIIHATTCAFVHVGIGYGSDINRDGDHAGRSAETSFADRQPHQRSKRKRCAASSSTSDRMGRFIGQSAGMGMGVQFRQCFLSQMRPAEIHQGTF